VPDKPQVHGNLALPTNIGAYSETQKLMSSGSEKSHFRSWI